MSDSSDYSSSSESEVEYEPIIVEDADGKKMTMKEESNPLAPPVIIVNTNATSSSSDKSGKAAKKSKVFASKDTMLSLIESVNNVQDGKIQAKLDRDASYLQRLKNIEKATQERKSMKHERLDKIKDNLRKGGIRVKGENKRIVRENHFKETAERESRNKSNGARSGGKSGGGKPSARPSGGKPSARPSGGKPGAKPSGRTTAKPTGRPAGKPAGRSTGGKPSGKPSSSGRPQKKVKFAV